VKKLNYAAKEFENLKFKKHIFKNLKFKNCTFKNCIFEDCKLIQTSFSNCSFYNCIILNIKTAGDSKIEDTDFIECQLTGIHWSELLPDFRVADPIRKLEKCHLKYNTFVEMVFKKFDFSNNEIYDSMFAKSQLTECKFHQCKLDRTEFLESNLKKSDFRGASAYKIDIMTCVLNGAKFSFPEVINLLDVLKIEVE
jgi:fluoroquinolone resistance protein